jgi:hypothetical protein
MGSYNDSMIRDERKKERENEMRVNEILNKPSPVKKDSNKRSYNEMKDDESNKVIIDLDDDYEREGLAVKLERIKNVTEYGTVSSRFSERIRRK